MQQDLNLPDFSNVTMLKVDIFRKTGGKQQKTEQHSTPPPKKKIAQNSMQPFKSHNRNAATNNQSQKYLKTSDLEEDRTQNIKPTKQRTYVKTKNGFLLKWQECSITSQAVILANSLNLQLLYTLAFEDN